MPKSVERPTRVPHDVEEGPDVGAFLDVVGEVEVAVVDVVGRDWPSEQQQRGDEPATTIVLRIRMTSPGWR